MRDCTKHRILNLMNWAAYGVEEYVEERLFELDQEGETIDTEVVEECIMSGVELVMPAGQEYHLSQALELAVKDRINVDDLVNKYADEEINNG